MKKIYLTICMGAFLIIPSVFLFPLTAHSQNLTEAQKQGRCQNNKNQIAALEAQLRVIDAELSQTMTKKEIEDARTEMVFVRSLKTKGGGTEDFHESERIGARYNFNFIDCILRKTSFVCWAELENIIAKKINKAMSLNRPALLAKKNEIAKQIATHRNNLVALGCDANNKTGNTPDISGTWKALNWSYEFTQNGKKFSWKITNDGAYGETADGEFLVGNRIKATWTNKNGKDSGEGTVTVVNGKGTQINWDNSVIFTRN